MSPPANIGAPDWQRATLGAGKLLATVAATQNETQVVIPPNTATLCVALPTAFTPTDVIVTGVTTGLQYPGVLRPHQSNLGTDSLYMFTILAALDEDVTVYVSPLPGSRWYVYAYPQTAVVDVPLLSTVLGYVQSSDPQNGLVVVGYDGASYRALSTDTNGRQIPLVPTIGLGESVGAGYSQLLAAPSSGAWYLFGLDVYSTGSSDNPITLSDTNGNTIAYDNPPTGGESHTVALQGFRTVGAVGVNATAAATVTLRYAPGP